MTSPDHVVFTMALLCGVLGLALRYPSYVWTGAGYVLVVPDESQRRLGLLAFLFALMLLITSIGLGPVAAMLMVVSPASRSASRPARAFTGHAGRRTQSPPGRRATSLRPRLLARGALGLNPERLAHRCPAGAARDLRGGSRALPLLAPQVNPRGPHA